LHVLVHSRTLTPSLHDALPISIACHMISPCDEKVKSKYVFRNYRVTSSPRILFQGAGATIRGGPGRKNEGDRRVGSEAKERNGGDRKSTRLNSSHQIISYAVFC